MSVDSNPVERNARGPSFWGERSVKGRTLSVTTGPTRRLFGRRPDLVPRVKTYLEKSQTSLLGHSGNLSYFPLFIRASQGCPKYYMITSLLCLRIGLLPLQMLHAPQNRHPQVVATCPLPPLQVREGAHSGSVFPTNYISITTGTCYDTILTEVCVCKDWQTSATSASLCTACCWPGDVGASVGHDELARGVSRRWR